MVNLLIKKARQETLSERKEKEMKRARTCPKILKGNEEQLMETKKNIRKMKRRLYP